jgi:hypothetical protein
MEVVSRGIGVSGSVRVPSHTECKRRGLNAPLNTIQVSMCVNMGYQTSKKVGKELLWLDAPVLAASVLELHFSMLR